MLHYKMISLILISLESSMPILAAWANKPMVAISPSYQKGDEMLSFTHLYVNLSLGPSAIAASSSSPIWVELESEGSLVAFSAIGYHHFTTSSGLKTTTPSKSISILANHVLTKVMETSSTYQHWKGKRQGFRVLSKAKKP